MLRASKLASCNCNVLLPCCSSCSIADTGDRIETCYDTGDTFTLEIDTAVSGRSKECLLELFETYWDISARYVYRFTSNSIAVRLDLQLVGSENKRVSRSEVDVTLSRNARQTCNDQLESTISSFADHLRTLRCERDKMIIAIMITH